MFLCEIGCNYHHLKYYDRNTIIKMEKIQYMLLNDQKMHLKNVFIVSIYVEKEDKSNYKTVYTHKKTLEVNATKISTSAYSR